MGGYPHPVPTGGYLHPVPMGGTPIQSWLGGTPSRQDQGIPIRIGCRHPPLSRDGGIHRPEMRVAPPPFRTGLNVACTGYDAGSTLIAVSHRRTFLNYVLNVLITLPYARMVHLSVLTSCQQGTFLVLTSCQQGTVSMSPDNTCPTDSSGANDRSQFPERKTLRHFSSQMSFGFETTLGV